eukprot:gene957-31702_t
MFVGVLPVDQPHISSIAAQQKNKEIGTLKEKLDQMKRDLKQANSKASEVEAGAAITEEELEEERARARRVLPKIPSKGRFSRGPRGSPEVQPVDTHKMAREQLVQEIRTLEGELEYTHEKNMKQEEELEILQGVLQEVQERREQEEAGGANAGVELPVRSGKLEDVMLADPGATVVTVLEGQLHSVIVDCRDVLDNASQVAVLYDELESREAQFEEVEKQNAELCDLVDEVNQELQVAKDAVVKLEEAAVAVVKAGGSASPEALAVVGAGDMLAESLGDIMDAAEKADDPNGAVAVAALRADYKAAIVQINELKEENSRLDATLLANRENRDLIVYGLLEKPVKAKDRKKLLKILKETAMAPSPAPSPATPSVGSPASTLDANAAASTPPSAIPATPGSKPRRTSGFRSFFNKGKEKETPAKSPMGKTSSSSSTGGGSSTPDTPSGTPRAAPVARPFPQELLTPGAKAPVPQIPASGLSRGAALLAKKSKAKEKEHAAKEKAGKVKAKELEKAEKDRQDRTMNLVASGEISAEELAMLKMMEEMNKQVTGGGR